MVSGAEDEAIAGRRRLMALLARASAEELERLLGDAGMASEKAVLLRGPETGLVTVRGRMGGGGTPFNVGEATVTRATVRLAGGEVGHAYALGRDRKKAHMAATIDALWQRPQLRAGVEALILEPLAAMLDEADAVRRAETAATRVDFFTMMRGED